jgi:hypothetical protein
MDPLQEGRSLTGEESGSFSTSPTSPFEGVEQLGRLGFKVEPAGKIRVFAMVDCFTQWALCPLHKAIFSLLKQIPQDGTFDQLAPIKSLIKSFTGPLYSFDLSSATDRIPLELQKALLVPYLGIEMVEVWGRLLVDRSYGHGSNSDWRLKAGTVKYSAGQPMGALSSWAMLALTHHALVQWSALRAGVIQQGGWYGHYAVLGDDVVIGGTLVAEEYLKVMSEIDVPIGIHKSLVSINGSALEFAKRTFYRGDDVSMVPIAEFLVGCRNVPALMELARKYSLNSVGRFLSVLGYGYRAKGSLSSVLTKLPTRLRYYITSFYGPGGPGFTSLKDWLTMRSISSTYKGVDRKVSVLFEQIFQKELTSLRERCEQLRPYVELAKKLATVYRDREHYGTSPRGSNRMNKIPGIDPEYPQHSLDSVNEILYRTAYLDLQVDFRDLLTSIESVTSEPPSWEALERLWKILDSIEDSLAGLSLPINLHVRTREKSSPTVMQMNQKRWLWANSVFRSTKG